MGRGMFRLAALLMLCAAPAAFAVGERVSLTGAAAPLAETLCISMTCVSGGAKDFVVTGRQVGEGLELTVTSSAGQRRLTHVVPMGEGRPSSTELVRATALVVKAIEGGPGVAAAASTQKPAATPTGPRKAPRRLFARR